MFHVSFGWKRMWRWSISRTLTNRHEPGGYMLWVGPLVIHYWNKATREELKREGR